MANISQHDIDDIVNIQLRISPQYHIINDVETSDVQGWLSQLTYLANVDSSLLANYIVKAKNRIIGVDTIALLQAQYNVASPTQLIFKNVKLGGALLKDAREVVFDHCDFTTCHATHKRISSFIRTNDDGMNDFTRARFLSCDLHEVLFRNVTLNQAYFANTKLSATQFLYSDLGSCDFESITFSRMPRFLHSNLYQSHAHCHAQDHNRVSHYYHITALMGGALISASALIITLIMFSVLPSAMLYTTMAISLLVAGVIMGYFGAAFSSRQKSIAQRYQMFEQTVDINAQKVQHIDKERQKIYAKSGSRW